MIALPLDATDDDLIAHVDRWAALLEKGAYEDAFGLTDHGADTGWSPATIREVIEAYGDAAPHQHVTLHGEPTDVTQRKDVTRWPTPRRQGIGAVWYDLNIDGLASDLTATFWIVPTDAGLVLRLDDIHVR